LATGDKASPAIDEVWKIIWGSGSHAKGTADQLKLYNIPTADSMVLAAIPNTATISNFTFMLNPISVDGTRITAFQWVDTTKLDFDRKTEIRWTGTNKIWLMILVRKIDAQGRFLA